MRQDLSPEQNFESLGLSRYTFTLEILLQKEYEWLDTSQLDPDNPPRLVPVPPLWVREKVNLPKRFQFASLGKEVKECYPPEIYEASVKFVRDWREALQMGAAPFLVGPQGKSKSYAAAAIASEITLRYSAGVDIQPQWFSQTWYLPILLQYKQTGDSTFFAVLSRYQSSNLLIIDNLLACTRYEGGISLVQSVLEYRWDHCLPTIVTASARVKGNWSHFIKIFGRSFVHKLLKYSDGYTVTL